MKFLERGLGIVMAGKSEADITWREKYLNALDQQELAEKKFTEQLEMLRSALVRVSLAADGQDEELDSILSGLREHLRGKQKTNDLSGLLARVEQAVISFEANRDQGEQTIRQALGDTVKVLQRFKLSRRVNKDIGKFLGGLAASSKKVHLYPKLLNQLAELQQQALQELEQPKMGLLGRLLGPKTNQAAADTTATTAKGLAQNPSDDHQLIVGNHQQAAQRQLGIVERTHTDVAKSIGIAPNYLVKISEILSAFLDGLEPEASLSDKVSAIRQRIEEGIEQEFLIPTLESVRDLVMEAYLIANNAFATYLNNVNQDLAEIYSLLGGAVKTTQDQRESSRQLQETMLREVSDLEVHAQNASDLNQLKSQVQSQIGNIKQAIDHHQKTDVAQQALAQQLNALSEKIKTMEVEAEKSRSNLELQRYKALHDPLTELPNREFYNLRAEEEVQRWQRYGRPLSIAILDIDLFKKINDNYGHQAGDRVIKVIGQSIAKRLREVDFFCRYGGEEFVALMPETDSQTALDVLEKIRAAIANATFNYKEQPMTITLSVGVAQFEQADSLLNAFERADAALYKAKSSGRNCCRLAEQT
jgi:diguanylate cyclase